VTDAVDLGPEEGAVVEIRGRADDPV
jgi:hypothetical protein